VQLVRSEPPAASVCPALEATTARIRLRPGERPYWADASPWQSSWDDWRVRAHHAGVPLDTAVSCLLEYELTRVELQRWVEQPELMLAHASERELDQARLCGDEEFRRWLDVLGHNTSHDDLPEIALPLRLMRSPAVRRGWGSQVKPDCLDQALRCERAAAIHAQTLEGWALRAGLTSVSSASKS
jgi:hypothetical protein